MDTKVKCKGLSVQVKPKIINAPVPCAGHHSDIKEVEIKNTGTQKLTFKAIPSKMHRFQIDKPCGFVDAGKTAIVEVQVTEFQESDGICATDKVTVLVAVAPTDVDDANMIWDDKSAHKPKDPQSHQVLIDYVFEEKKR